MSTRRPKLKMKKSHQNIPTMHINSFPQVDINKVAKECIRIPILIEDHKPFHADEHVLFRHPKEKLRMNPSLYKPLKDLSYGTKDHRIIPDINIKHRTLHIEPIKEKQLIDTPLTIRHDIKQKLNESSENKQNFYREKQFPHHIPITMKSNIKENIHNEQIPIEIKEHSLIPMSLKKDIYQTKLSVDLLSEIQYKDDINLKLNSKSINQDVHQEQSSDLYLKYSTKDKHKPQTLTDKINIKVIEDNHPIQYESYHQHEIKNNYHSTSTKPIEEDITNKNIEYTLVKIFPQFKSTSNAILKHELNINTDPIENPQRLRGKKSLNNNVDMEFTNDYEDEESRFINSNYNLKSNKLESVILSPREDLDIYEVYQRIDQDKNYNQQPVLSPLSESESDEIYKQQLKEDHYEKIQIELPESNEFNNQNLPSINNYSKLDKPLDSQEFNNLENYLDESIGDDINLDRKNKIPDHYNKVIVDPLESLTQSKNNVYLTMSLKAPLLEKIILSESQIEDIDDDLPKIIKEKSHNQKIQFSNLDSLEVDNLHVWNSKSKFLVNGNVNYDNNHDVKDNPTRSMTHRNKPVENINTDVSLEVKEKIIPLLYTQRRYLKENLIVDDPKENQNHPETLSNSNIRTSNNIHENITQNVEHVNIDYNQNNLYNNHPKEKIRYNIENVNQEYINRNINKNLPKEKLEYNTENVNQEYINKNLNKESYKELVKYNVENTNSEYINRNTNSKLHNENVNINIENINTEYVKNNVRKLDFNQNPQLRLPSPQNIEHNDYQKNKSINSFSKPLLDYGESNSYDSRINYKQKRDLQKRDLQNVIYDSTKSQYNPSDYKETNSEIIDSSSLIKRLSHNHYPKGLNYEDEEINVDDSQKLLSIDQPNSESVIYQRDYVKTEDNLHQLDKPKLNINQQVNRDIESQEDLNTTSIPTILYTKYKQGILLNEDQKELNDIEYKTLEIRHQRNHKIILDNKHKFKEDKLRDKTLTLKKHVDENVKEDYEDKNHDYHNLNINNKNLFKTISIVDHGDYQDHDYQKEQLKQEHKHQNVIHAYDQHEQKEIINNLKKEIQLNPISSGIINNQDNKSIKFKDNFQDVTIQPKNSLQSKLIIENPSNNNLDGEAPLNKTSKIDVKEFLDYEDTVNEKDYRLEEDKVYLLKNDRDKLPVINEFSNNENKDDNSEILITIKDNKNFNPIINQDLSKSYEYNKINIHNKNRVLDNQRMINAENINHEYYSQPLKSEINNQELNIEEDENLTYDYINHSLHRDDLKLKIIISEPNSKNIEYLQKQTKSNHRFDLVHEPLKDKNIEYSKINTSNKKSKDVIYNHEELEFLDEKLNNQQKDITVRNLSSTLKNQDNQQRKREMLGENQEKHSMYIQKPIELKINNSSSLKQENPEVIRYDYQTSDKNTIRHKYKQEIKIDRESTMKETTHLKPVKLVYNIKNSKLNHVNKDIDFNPVNEKHTLHGIKIDNHIRPLKNEDIKENITNNTLIKHIPQMKVKISEHKLHSRLKYQHMD
jgi:hypothetical protein